MGSAPSLPTLRFLSPPHLPSLIRRKRAGDQESPPHSQGARCALRHGEPAAEVPSRAINRRAWEPRFSRTDAPNARPRQLGRRGPYFERARHETRPNMQCVDPSAHHDTWLPVPEDAEDAPVRAEDHGAVQLEEAGA